MRGSELQAGFDSGGKKFILNKKKNVDSPKKHSTIALEEASS